MALALTVSSGLAMAATREQSGGGCCTLLFVLLFVAIYRSGGTDWVRSIAAAAFPGLFGWFIWRDRALGAGARWVALIFACLQVFFFLLGVIAAIALPQVLARAAAAANSAQQSRPSGVGSSTIPEDPALGLHPLSTVTSVPPGAQVFVNGQLRGRTPLETPMTAGQGNEVKVELGGYFSQTQSQTPNAREHLVFSFNLKEAARLELETTPPGARVLVGTEQVLARTPGVAQPLEPGELELLVLLDGHQPLRHSQRLPSGETRLALTLEPGVKIAVGSTPDQADVFVDGAWLGRSPLDVFVSPKGKHTLELRKEPYAPVSKTFSAVKKPTSFRATLVDVERQAAAQAVAKARARYDRVNDALEKLQTKIEHRQTVPARLERQLAGLEREMEKAASALEAAEAKLKEVEEAHGTPAPTPAPEDDDAR